MNDCAMIVLYLDNDDVKVIARCNQEYSLGTSRAVIDIEKTYSIGSGRSRMDIIKSAEFMAEFLGIDCNIMTCIH